MASVHSGLQVPDSSLPEHDQPQKEAFNTDNGPIVLSNSVHSYHNYPEHPPSKQRVCGLSPLLFGFLVALISAIAVGAAVGGGVGSQLASCRDVAAQSVGGPSTVTETITRSYYTNAPTSVAPSASPTIPYVDYSVAAPTDVNRLAFDCGGLDNTEMDITVHDLKQTFELRCDQWFDGNPTLVGFWAYTFDDCVLACTEMNSVHNASDPGSKGPCGGASFTPNMAAAADTGYGNCYLQGNSSVLGPLGDTVSAVLTG